MKKTMTGMLAFSKMMGSELPEKTGTYTPISHHQIISKVRSEIIDAGFTITREDYSCTSDGKVAVGSFGLVYKADPYIELCANFMNSYNKRYAFRFSLGGFIKKSNAVFMITDSTHGSFKRMHTGLADILSSHKIKELIDNAGEYWDSLVNAKDIMISVKSNSDDLYRKTGQLFFEKKILNTFQMSQIREQYELICKEAETEERNLTLWDVYSAVTFGVREGNPTTWMNDLESIHETFRDILNEEEHKKFLKSIVTTSTEITEAGANYHTELENMMISAGLVDEESFKKNTDPIVIPDDPNVLRVSYQPSDEEISALKEAGIQIVVDKSDFEEDEFEDLWESGDDLDVMKEEDVSFVETEDFELEFEESFHIPRTDDDDDDDDIFN
jgi:hypothetical protein